MKRAFTLIELIFVIVIIGLLAAVAVPKFMNLKQHAEANSVVKTTVDAAQQAVETASNMMDLENDYNFTLKDIVKLKGKNWSLANNDNSYEYNTSSSKIVAEINLSLPSREVNYSIDCNNFDPTTQQACVKELNNENDGNITNVHLKF